MTARLSDWERRLNALLLEVRGREHAYGQHDCMLFAAAAVRALTGADLARGHRRKYRSAATAARYLKSLGFASPAEMTGGYLDEVPVALARRGDIVAKADGAVGVCLGAKAAFVGAEGGRQGLITLPLLSCTRAWRVGA